MSFACGGETTSVTVVVPSSLISVNVRPISALGLIVTLRTYALKNDCEVESLLPIMKGAEWIEREMHELFGIEFRNHPNMKPLLLPDDWPKDKYPLRKDYKLSTKKGSHES